MVIHPKQFQNPQAVFLAESISHVVESLYQLYEKNPDALFSIQAEIRESRDFLGMLNADIEFKKAVHADLIGKMGRKA